jgi:hypothetical protein
LIKVLEIRAEPRKKKKGDDRPRRRQGRHGWPLRPRRRRGRDLTEDGDDAAGRDVAGGGEVKKLKVGVRDLRVGGAVVAGVRWLPELAKIVRVWWSPKLRRIAGAAAAGG